MILLTNYSSYLNEEVAVRVIDKDARLRELVKDNAKEPELKRSRILASARAT